MTETGTVEHAAAQDALLKWQRALRPEAGIPEEYSALMNREQVFVGENVGKRSEYLLYDVLNLAGIKQEGLTMDGYDTTAMQEIRKNPSNYLNDFGLFLAEKTKNKPWVDLAAGSNHSKLATLAHTLGASEYIADDIAYDAYLATLIDSMPAIQAPKDMLLFCSALPDNYAGIIFIGPMGYTFTKDLQEHIERITAGAKGYLEKEKIKDKDPRISQARQNSERYQQFLRLEISRVLKPDGVVVAESRYYPNGINFIDSKNPKLRELTSEGKQKIMGTIPHLDSIRESQGLRNTGFPYELYSKI